MRRRSGWLPVLVLAVCLGCARGESYVREGYDFSRLRQVAVVEVEGNLPGEAARNQVANWFAMELLKKGYQPIERRQARVLLAEQEFQATELTGAVDAARAGRILNVDAVMMVAVPEMNEEISITARLVDAEDGSVLWVGSGSGTTGRTVSTVAGAAIGGAAGAAAGGDDSGQLGGAATGVTLGGAVGYALAPKQAAQARKVVGCVCRQLPSPLTRQ